MSSRTWHSISLIAGLAVLAMAIFGAVTPAPPVCGSLASGYAPIIAFELARNVSDLHAIFGASPGACRSATAAQMDFINTIDSYAFIPAYGMFLLFFFLGQGAKNRTVAMLAIAIVILSCLADYVENFALFHLSPDPDRATWIPLLIAATETKWVGLGIAGALAVPLLWKGWIGWLALVACGIGLVATLATIPASRMIGPYLSNALTLGWLLFLLIDIREIFRPTAQSAATVATPAS